MGIRRANAEGDGFASLASRGRHDLTELGDGIASTSAPMIDPAEGVGERLVQLGGGLMRERLLSILPLGYMVARIS